MGFSIESHAGTAGSCTLAHELVDDLRSVDVNLDILTESGC
jgi:hypothetical protein